jgi:uncharacterized protein YgiB involved in biofilm formation
VKRSSGKITLVLLGAALLNGCNRSVETRDIYLARNDCVQDWGDARRCEENYNQSTGMRHYFGPAYSGARDAPNPRSESKAVSSQSVVRGGFGASASAHAGSGT